nr:hypothetical protein [Pseudomonas folii]
MENSFCNRWVKFGSTLFIRLAGGAWGGSHSGTTGFDVHPLSASSDSSKQGLILFIGFGLFLSVLRVEIKQQLLGFLSRFIGSGELLCLFPLGITIKRDRIADCLLGFKAKGQIGNTYQQRHQNPHPSGNQFKDGRHGTSRKKM